MCRKEEYKIKNKYQIKRIQGKTKQNKKKEQPVGTVVQYIQSKKYPKNHFM
jgi:hypothetical protein